MRYPSGHGVLYASTWRAPSSSTSRIETDSACGIDDSYLDDFRTLRFSPAVARCVTAPTRFLQKAPMRSENRRLLVYPQFARKILPERLPPCSERNRRNGVRGGGTGLPLATCPGRQTRRNSCAAIHEDMVVKTTGVPVEAGLKPQRFTLTPIPPPHTTPQARARLTALSCHDACPQAQPDHSQCAAAG